MNSKEYKLPNGKIAVFEYDVCGIGKITLECMDELMAMIADRPQGEWIEINIKDYKAKCSCCGTWSPIMGRYCPNCGADMRKESE